MASQPVHYTVVAGDSVSLISKKLFGDFSQTQRIIDMNPALKSNPNLIQPGQSLLVPTDVSKADVIEDAQVVESTTGSNTKTIITKYIGWVFLAGVVVLLGYEANKQRKKNKSGSKPKPAAKGVAGLGSVDDHYQEYLSNFNKMKSPAAKKKYRSQIRTTYEVGSKMKGDKTSEAKERFEAQKKFLKDTRSK